VSNFYGAEIEIWAGLGPFGSIKKMWPIMSNYSGQFFDVCISKNKNLSKNILASPLKSCIK
jgi:hypothetical protein